MHARKLEEANYIVCTKSFDGRLPKTEYRLAGAGRQALERYLNHMEALIRATRRGVKRDSRITAVFFRVTYFILQSSL